MKQLFTEMKKHLSMKEDLVFVTVVASSGAVPRGTGARMLVGKSGQICGTVGGGMVEYRSEQMALEALATRSSKMKQFILKRNEVEDIGMICGGDVTLYFKYLEGQNPKWLKFCEEALALFDKPEKAWLVSDLSDDGDLGIYSKGKGLIGMEDKAGLVEQIKGRTCKFEWEGHAYYAEEMMTPGYVHIFGGGHVSRELVPVLSHLGFRCKVYEDREDFLSTKWFSQAVETKIVNFENIEAMQEVTSEDYIVIMTRGHKFDTAVEMQALRTPAKYIGVIGSKHKKASVEKELIKQGFTRKDINRVTTPIGLLEIGSDTPEEIAISIAGQLIGVRAGKGVIS